VHDEHPATAEREVEQPERRDDEDAEREQARATKIVVRPLSISAAPRVDRRIPR
jgi:hypothetical protein